MILESPLTYIVEHERRIAADMLEERAAHKMSNPDRRPLNPRRDVHAVANQIIPLHHHIRDMETEPHLDWIDSPVLRPGERTADLDGAAHGVHGDSETPRVRHRRRCLKTRPSSRLTFSEMSAWQLAKRSAVCSSARSIIAE